MPRIHRWLTVASLLVLVGCLGPLEPDTGDLAVDDCENEDSNPAVDVSFAKHLLGDAFVQPVNGCLDCHDILADEHIGVDLGGLDLSSYQGLMKGGVNSASNIVIPDEPCQSVLYIKLTPAPSFGSQMPLGGPFLSEEKTGLVIDWIAEGADDD